MWSKDFVALLPFLNFEIPLNSIDNIADVDIATSRYAAVDDVFFGGLCCSF
jgi:hypothetical protein